MNLALRCGALFFAAGTLILSPLAAQNAPRVQHVSVLGSGQAIEVEIRTSANITPETQAISGPDRIVIDFPGALPAPELRNLNVNRGLLKSIRTGLFSANPPITRVVLDLAAAQPYQVFSGRNSVMLKVGTVPSSRLTEAAFVTRAESTGSESANSASTSSGPTSSAPTSAVLPLADQAAPEPLKPASEVSYEFGLLRIHVEHSTLAKVLFEIQQQTGAEIAIPAGAESEEIAAELGPAPVRDVLAELLNGSRYNFVFVEKGGGGLQKVILTLRDGTSAPQFAALANPSRVISNSPHESVAPPPADADAEVPSEEQTPPEQ